MVNLKSLYNSYKYKDKISYSVFTDIIKSFNKTCLEEISKGKDLNMGFSIGTLSVITVENKPREALINKTIVGKINWPKSKKLKKEIEDRGGTPLKYFKDDEGKILGDNGGEAWQIYYTDSEVKRLFWSRYRIKKESKGDHYPIKRIRRFHFSFADDAKKKIRKLNNNDI